jgi:tetratricopeptide (TPR) repeat protein
MGKRVNFFLSFFVFLIFSLYLSGCGIRNTYIDVIQGNYYYGRGLYQAAIVSYMRALESGKHREWVEYNLGNAYQSLGEVEAAVSVWDKAAETQDPALLFHIAFNKGSLYYELGKYREAYDEFKQALRLDPSALDAKINLELSLRKMNSGGGGPSPQSRSGADAAAEDPGRILDYIKKKETTKWTASDDSAAADSGDW